ncbi:oxaloacetate decarboxylase [Falsiroseomonas sp.]|uniref:isocitrate lyase/PEP mutase family protein n=1 Tax=Falsiroseomonas sp. TaxID=2870721 RepID=UPI0034A2C294
MPRQSLKPLLARGKCLVAPGVFDLISTHILNQHGAEATYMTGFGVVASALGLPDAGLATYTEMLDRARRIAEFSKAPVIADADTGYGGLLNVRHTVRGYEAAGIAAIQLEDQEFPKKCGHTPGRRVIPLTDMVRKIEVAADSRSSADFLIIARTDSRTTLGLDEALRRAEAFAKAGADILFVESPESEAEMEAIGRAFDQPLLANMVEGGRTPILPRARLAELGFQVAIYPAAGFLSTAATLDQMYRHLATTGSSLDAPVPVFDFKKLTDILGFPDVHAFERRWADGA